MNRILLIEDNQIIQMISRDMLFAIKEIDCHVDVAGTIKEALEFISEHLYDLILMDIGLPDGNGYDLTKEIRANPDPLISEVPIIAVTGHSDPADFDRAKAIGMTDMLIKPLTIATMKTFTKYLPNQ